MIFLASPAASAISGKVFDAAGTMVGVYLHPAVANTFTKSRDEDPRPKTNWQRWCRSCWRRAANEPGADPRRR